MSFDPSLSTVLVAGVNTRPIVKSAKGLGLKVIAVDHFDDVDLARSADTLFSAKEAGNGGKFEGLPQPTLFELARKALRSHDVDAILLSSGMEHEPSSFRELEKMSEIIGNGPDQLDFCKDQGKIFELADELDVPHPLTERVRDVGEALEAAEDIGYPALLKPARHGGGIGIKLARSSGELRTSFDELSSMDRGDFVYVQEYIEGTDASASVLSDGAEAKCLSVNEQIVGRERLAVPRRFGYCGNVVPLDADPNLVSRIAEYSQKICREIGLLGSNGIDFVIDEGKPYLMEINPRFQGTMECVERVLGINLVKEHIRACRGEIGEFGNPNDWVVKLILYAHEDVFAPDLTGFRGLVDIPRKGSIVEKGKPICTVLKSGGDRAETIEDSYRLADKVQKVCQNEAISSSPTVSS